ncbi:MAG: serine/threonine-protein kinase [Chthoniobacteraceae bacterium]
MPDETPNPRPLTGLDAAALVRLGMSGAPGDTAFTLPGYKILESLGRGGMGEVFRARQESLGREVAVKILRSDLHSDGWLPERFEREARTMAALRHPNLVTVHDCVRLDGGGLAIVMELVDGGALRRHIADGGLPLAQALVWARDIAEGLRAAHEAGIVHRDVKPENVLIDGHGRARVGDFGMAFSTAAEVARFTQTGTALGTVGYMAPEQLRGEAVDARTDVFSFGVLLYEMLTGRLPQGSFSRARELRREVPEALDAFVLTALRPEPARRPAGMADALRALDAMPAIFTRRRVLAAGVAAAVAGVSWWVGKRKPASVTEPPWQRIEWPADPGASAIAGKWWKDGGWLLTDDKICILPVLREMPRACDFRMRFRRLGGIHSIAIFVGTPRGMGVCTLDGRALHLGGLQSVNGKTLQDGGGFEMALENGRTYEWTIEWRPGRVRMWLDGQLKNERDIAGATLSVPETWAWTPDAKTPPVLIGSWNSPTRFEWIEWRAAEA